MKLSVLLLATVAAAPVLADEAANQATRAEIEAAFGSVPSFIEALPQSALAPAWALTRDLELSEDTALDARTKALISLAVASQIPCDYCVWVDTQGARAAGATDEEIREAVAMAGLTRFWSTVLNGNRVDLETFMADLGGP